MPTSASALPRRFPPNALRSEGAPAPKAASRGIRSVVAAVTLAAGFFGMGFFGVVGCSSVSRTPATGGAPVEAPKPDSSPAPEAEADAPASEEALDPQGLTADEILALPPEVGSGSDILDISAMTLEELNAIGQLQDVRFDYDSAELATEARQTLQRNAEWLSSHAAVRILIEGHCDERGTVEYNLALGEERARAVRDYLGELGIGAERMRTISYGKEFPADPGHNESAWRKNRRAHLEIIAK